MPIELDSNDEIPPVRPGTNAHELLSILLDYPEMGCTPKELAEMTDVPIQASIRRSHGFEKRTRPHSRFVLGRRRGYRIVTYRERSESSADRSRIRRRRIWSRQRLG